MVMMDTVDPSAAEDLPEYWPQAPVPRVEALLEQMTLVLGIARKEKISLAAASDKVAKVKNGNAKAAKELGITTKDTTKAMPVR